MSKADDVFLKEFLTILGALVVFTIVVFFVSRAIGANELVLKASHPAAVAKRIQPVGLVKTNKTAGAPAKQ